jgi:hypothetical protein
MTKRGAPEFAVKGAFTQLALSFNAQSAQQELSNVGHFLSPFPTSGISPRPIGRVSAVVIQPARSQLSL